MAQQEYTHTIAQPAEAVETLETAEAPEAEQTAGLAEVAALCEDRATTYEFLARFYRTEVDQEFLEVLRGMRFPLSTGNPKLDRGYRSMAKFTSNTWANSLVDLAQEYVRVFIGHGNDAFAAAYPFESVYTSEKRLLMQDARDEMLAIYRSYGIKKADDWKEGEDHISLELEFMSVLCRRAANALRQGQEEKAVSLLSAQLNFLSDHLVAWVPMLTADMRKFAKTDLYQGLCLVTEGFLESDLELLSDILADDEETSDGEACAAASEPAAPCTPAAFEPAAPSTPAAIEPAAFESDVAEE